ncbi:hypothetical protein SH1V18_44250 [Vallitalea longa]|uniref:Uncharacterized protein n=1 Tax=Vallitalea longa TaxID=2936439 RepID=A0A9W5YD85_9FIRM|nr:hypothetical protein [Vallitalea longa]GKX31945.1 hypothetical protein SH1V18_44250 [Vallitalea longa]
MKFNKKLLNIPIILMIIIAVLCLLNVPSRIHMLNGISGADKIGIISISYNKDDNKHEESEEVFITKKEDLYKIINTINDGKINTEVSPKRPIENYRFNFYKDSNIIVARYWKDEKYNISIEGVEGEIRVDDKLTKIINGLINDLE